MSHMQYFLFHRLLRLKLNTYLIVPVVVVVINIISIVIINNKNNSITILLP